MHRPEFSTATAAAMTGSQEKQAAPQFQPPAAGGSVADLIMPQLLNIYGSCATMARDFEMYAPNATYEGPLMRAHGGWWGRLAEAGRRGAMLLTHALMGFGKDPKPAQPHPPPSQSQH
ncbi:uncharacterized protein [Miscanthus floridulus]|uniref:uncharacterized protein n=1 Tax=Miscanthus floridulus TaxID=154761 RepID=UPI003457EA0A